MGLNFTKFVGGDINEYEGQHILYNRYPFYNSRNRPMTRNQTECYERRNRCNNRTIPLRKVRKVIPK